MIITLDFETYYDKPFSLTKLTTEEYIRDDRFEVIGVAVAIDDGVPEWFSGTQADTKAFLKKFDWENALWLPSSSMNLTEGGLLFLPVGYIK